MCIRDLERGLDNTLNGESAASLDVVIHAA
jgi:hypothetical protein